MLTTSESDEGDFLRLSSIEEETESVRGEETDSKLYLVSLDILCNKNMFSSDTITNYITQEITKYNTQEITIIIHKR